MLRKIASAVDRGVKTVRTTLSTSRWLGNLLLATALGIVLWVVHCFSIRGRIEPEREPAADSERIFQDIKGQLTEEEARTIYWRAQRNVERWQGRPEPNLKKAVEVNRRAMRELLEVYPGIAFEQLPVPQTP